MEIEAWFISEYTHFSRISAKLTLERITRAIRFDPSQDDMQRRLRPAKDLTAIYKVVGATYVKEEASIRKTLDALDFERICVELVSRFEDVRLLVAHVKKLLPLRANARHGKN
jgi:hypothetical protein